MIYCLWEDCSTLSPCFHLSSFYCKGCKEKILYIVKISCAWCSTITCLIDLGKTVLWGLLFTLTSYLLAYSFHVFFTSFCLKKKKKNLKFQNLFCVTSGYDFTKERNSFNLTCNIDSWETCFGIVRMHIEFFYSVYFILKQRKYILGIGYLSSSIWRVIIDIFWFA